MSPFINKKESEFFSLTLINLIYNLSTYVVLPIMALYLNVVLRVPLIMVGILLGLPSIVSAILGSVASILTNKIGKLKVLIIALILYSAVYIAFGMVGRNVNVLIFLSILLGVCRVLWQPTMQSVFARHSNKLHNPDNAFRLNYLTIVLGAVFGSSVVFLLGGFRPRISLYISAIIFAFLTFLLILNKGLINEGDLFFQGKSKNQNHWKNIFGELKDVNRNLILYIFAGTMVYLVFSVFESVLSLFLEGVSADPVKIFSSLLIINSICGLLFQVIIIYSKKRINTKTSLFIGSAAFSIAFILFAILGNRYINFVIATVLFTVGEVLLIPLNDIVINQIAPEDKKTLYFSLAEFKIIGFTIGPILFSFILSHYGYKYMFFTSAIIILFSSIVYIIPIMNQRNKGSNFDLQEDILD